MVASRIPFRTISDSSTPRTTPSHGYRIPSGRGCGAREPVSWQTQPGKAVDYWADHEARRHHEIGKRPDIFLSAAPRHPAHRGGHQHLPPTLIQMDPPKHGDFRQMVSRRFTPRMLQKIHAPIEKIGREIVEKLYARATRDLRLRDRGVGAAADPR